MSELETTVILLVDGSPESTEAQKLCDAAGVFYRLFDLRQQASQDLTAPSIHSRHFKSFQGLDDIKDYIARYHRVDLVLRNTPQYQ